jgi:hypothetical protein
MWKTASSERYSRLWGLRLAGWQSGSTIAPVPLITSASLPSGIPYVPPPMPPPRRPSGSTMLVRLNSVIFGHGSTSLSQRSNAPNGEAHDDERTADDIARGLEEVVRLNRVQFEAFAVIRRDLEDLTKRIKGGNLLLLPRSPHPRSAPRKRTRE